MNSDPNMKLSLFTGRTRGVFKEDFGWMINWEGKDSGVDERRKKEEKRREEKKKKRRVEGE